MGTTSIICFNMPDHVDMAPSSTAPRNAPAPGLLGLQALISFLKLKWISLWCLRGWHSHVLCTSIFVRGQNKSKINLIYSSRSTVKPLYLFEVLGQGQSKILAKMSAVIRSMQCSIKKISVKILTADEDQSTHHM